jgi:hypothetical protein
VKIQAEEYDKDWGGFSHSWSLGRKPTAFSNDLLIALMPGNILGGLLWAKEVLASGSTKNTKSGPTGTHTFGK